MTGMPEGLELESRRRIYDFLTANPDLKAMYAAWLLNELNELRNWLRSSRSTVPSPVASPKRRYRPKKWPVPLPAVSTGERYAPPAVPLLSVLTTNAKGAIAETAIAKAALEVGYDVYRPMFEGGRYDLIFDTGEKLLQSTSSRSEPKRTDG